MTQGLYPISRRIGEAELHAEPQQRVMGGNAATLYRV